MRLLNTLMRARLEFPLSHNIWGTLVLYLKPASRPEGSFVNKPHWELLHFTSYFPTMIQLCLCCMCFGPFNCMRIPRPACDEILEASLLSYSLWPGHVSSLSLLPPSMPTPWVVCAEPLDLQPCPAVKKEPCLNPTFSHPHDAKSEYSPPIRLNFTH